MRDKATTYKQPRLLGLALNTAILLETNSLIRKERESILDKISGPFEDKAKQDTLQKDDPMTTEADVETENTDSVLLKELSAMTRLMGQRNPTSELVSGHSVFLGQLLTINSVPMRPMSGISPVLAIDKRLKENQRRQYC